MKLVIPFPSLLHLISTGLVWIIFIWLEFLKLKNPTKPYAVNFTYFLFFILGSHFKSSGILLANIFFFFLWLSPSFSSHSLSPCSLDGLHFLPELKPLLPMHQEERISCTSLRPEALLFLPHTQHPIVWLYLGPKSILNWFPSWQICVFHLVLGPGFHLNISNNFLFFQGEVLLYADNLYMTSENEKIKS